MSFDQENDDEGGTLYRIEVAANRTDLLSVEGIGRALKIFIGKGSSPVYTLHPPQPIPQSKMIVRASVSKDKGKLGGDVLL